jgi:hypothetical protein
MQPNFPETTLVEVKSKSVAVIVMLYHRFLTQVIVEKVSGVLIKLYAMWRLFLLEVKTYLHVTLLGMVLTFALQTLFVAVNGILLMTIQQKNLTILALLYGAMSVCLRIVAMK